jgi:hypothetical protein
MHWLLLTLNVLGTPLVPEAEWPTSPFRQVRAVDSRTSAALTDGVRRSPTFASLIATINRSDVIVYIESVHTLPSMIAGRMILASTGSSVRYVRIQVSERLVLEDLISTIGHELQHAVEVAEHADVRTGGATLYRYDTDAAVRIGAEVRKELRRT